MQNLNVRKKMYGGTERHCFSRLDEIMEVPDLLEIQKRPYKEFLKTGIRKVLNEFSPISDYSGKAKLYFLDINIAKEPKYSVKACKRRGGNYSVPLKVKARFVIEESGEAVEQEVFLGDIPYMTDEGSFIYNGIERVVVSQIIRSPGVFYSRNKDDSGTLKCQMLPVANRGMWVEFEFGANEVMKVVLDKTSKITVGLFLKCFGYTSDEILKLFGNHKLIKHVLDRESQKTQEEALLEFARRTRPADIPSEESTRNYLNMSFFSDQRYDMSRVGRYKFNKKLCIAERITGFVAAENIALGNEVLVKAGDMISAERARKIKDAGINEVFVEFKGKKHLIRGNNRVKLSSVFPCNEKELGVLEEVYYPALLQILKENKTKEKRMSAIKENATSLMITTLTMDDILAAISYFLNLYDGLGNIDNIDHLSNRRIASVGELLCSVFRSGINKLAATIKETLQGEELEKITPTQIVSPRAINKAFKDFIASGQLSQLMDQNNPLSGLTQKRKISAVGPGGIKKDRASAEVRDIHYTHYGRICVIETPEGQSIGLMSTLANFAKVNDYGFLETPYKPVDKKTGKVQNTYEYHTADLEDKYYIAQSIEPIDKDGRFVNERVLCRHQDTVSDVSRDMVDYVDVSAKQFVSASTALIPFLENNDPTRALMGANMQRQAVPLLRTESPIVGTGMEAVIAHDCGAATLARENGEVTYVSADEVRVRTLNGEDVYYLTKFAKTNADTCANQKPNVVKGQFVKKGDVIIDGMSTDKGELALGKNVLIGFMNWEGYNYEDAILISERLVKEDIYTSITLGVEEIKARTTKLGDEEITRDIPNLSEDALKNLDENGIVRIGADVRPGDILVGKVTPKGETELTPEERLLRAIFGEKAREVRDASLRVQHGKGGVVVDVQIFSRKNKDDLEAGVNMMVKVYVAQRRKLSVGDKMCGRYGNKGVVSRILPEADMPFMANGQPLDIVLNPLGVSSRMNIGQVLEVHLGLVAKSLGWKVATPVFNGAKAEDIQELLKANNFPENGKIQLYDGRTGEPFDNPTTVGYKYMLKLEHMVDSKVHARAIGPYSLVTRQPLGGKAMFGGQRFGEMEVWALEAYGAAHILQEILTVKSDDVVGRIKTYEAIVKGQPIAEPGVPESFKVLIKELQAIGMDIKILTENKQEISMSELSGEDNDVSPLATEVEEDLKDITLDFDLPAVPSESEEGKGTVIDESGLFDEFEDFDE